VLEERTPLSTTGIRTLPRPPCNQVAILRQLPRLLRQGNTSCNFFHESDRGAGNRIHFLWNPAAQYCIHSSLQTNVIQTWHPLSLIHNAFAPEPKFPTWYIPFKYGPFPHSVCTSFYELHAENNYNCSILHFGLNPTLETFVVFNVCRQTVSVGDVINVVQCPTSTDLI
jgi:hypothetical protein